METDLQIIKIGDDEFEISKNERYKIYKTNNNFLNQELLKYKDHILVIYKDGAKQYRFNGKYHRLDGPQFIYTNRIEYHIHGKYYDNVNEFYTIQRKCPICKQVFGNLADLLDHLKTYTNSNEAKYMINYIFTILLK